MSAALELGVLLPHFGNHSTPACLVEHAPRLEQLGYDSAWVRDNLAYAPHEFEPPGRCFVDPFVTLAAIAARTTTLGLGTAVTIPFRAPAVTAQLLGSLCWLAPGRVRLGMGFGSPRKAFHAAGLGFTERFARCEETIALVRALGSGISLDTPTIDPAPEPDLPVWFGGSSPRALRLASASCDGLLFARADLCQFVAVRGRLERPLRFGTVVLVLPGRSYADAVAGVDVDALLRELSAINRRDYDSLRQAQGAVIAGSPDDCIEGMVGLAAAGVELIVIDLRLSFDRFQLWTEVLGNDVLPQVRAAVLPTHPASTPD